MAYIEVKDCCKFFPSGQGQITANKDLNFDIQQGELVIILGASGAGKSTLLNILGGMDTASQGEIWIDGQNIAAYTSHQRTDYRRYDVGFVFQSDRPGKCRAGRGNRAPCHGTSSSPGRRGPQPPTG